MSTEKDSKKNSNTLKYINNILPGILVEESLIKSFTYYNLSLKSAYLIDLTSYIISRFFLTKNNKISLSSTILRKRYGANYSLYVRYLVEKNIVQLVKNHLNGKNSRIYQLNEKILDSKLTTFKNYDTILLKKFQLNNNQNITLEEKVNHIDQDVKSKLIQDLYIPIINSDCSEYLLNSLVLDRNTLICNQHSVDCINNKQIFYHFDNYGRMHTNFTNLKSIIRKHCLYLDGEESLEIDIKNSQPLFLNKLIDQYKTDHYFSIPEINLYKELTRNGEFYSFLSEKSKIKDIKLLKDSVYKVLFGRNYPNKFENFFGSVFPTIYEFIKFYKRNMGGYKVLSHNLQILESDFIFNKTIKDIIKIDNAIPLLTVHDSIICKKSDYTIVKKIFEKNLKTEFDQIADHSDIEMKFNIYEYD